MTDTAILDDLLDVLKAALKASPVDDDLVERLKRDLRDLNGIDGTGVLTDDVYRTVRLRLHQGYTLREIGWMTGLARSTVGNVRGGHRKARIKPICRPACTLQGSAQL
ncbi:MAG: hypothetical protein RL375_858 [Pseudomonadota bacterium]|jgi:hypothetical protein